VLDGDSKDVLASQMTNNQHNELNIRFGQSAAAGGNVLSYRDQDLTKCKIHKNEDIKAFCKNDLCSICFKCLLVEHRNHDVVMLDEIEVEDLKDKAGQFHDKVENQINQLASMREKVSSIKENYDKKFEELFV